MAIARRKAKKKAAKKKVTKRRVTKKRVARKATRKGAERWDPGKVEYGVVDSSGQMGKILEGLGFHVRYKKSRKPGYEDVDVGGVGIVTLETSSSSDRLALTVEFENEAEPPRDMGAVNYRIIIGSYSRWGKPVPMSTAVPVANNVLSTLTDALAEAASDIDLRFW